MKIKPCPFCQGKALLKATRDVPEDILCDTVWDIHCTTPECYLEFGADWRFETPQQALLFWNHRKGE
jgi:hypothetical protein